MGKRAKAEAEAKEEEQEHAVAGVDAAKAKKMKKDKKKMKKKSKKDQPEAKEKDAMAKDTSDNRGKEERKKKKSKKDKKKRSDKKEAEHTPTSQQHDGAETEHVKEAQQGDAKQRKKSKKAKKEKKNKKKKQKHGDAEENEGSADDEHPQKRAKVSSKHQGSSKQKRNGSGNGAAAKHSESGIQFDFYEEHEALGQLSASSIKEMRKKDRVDVQGFNGESTSAFKPVPKFGQSGMRTDVMKVCAGFEKPTPIQKHTWSIVLRGRDVVGIAATGSGKTLAFGLPGLVHSAARGRPAKGTPFMLVLAPTRELAMQTAKVLQDAGQRMEPQLNVQCIYGGAQRQEQIQAMKKGVHAIVATPGRLLDLCEAGAINLNAVSFCVLDEADRMLDLGFERDIKRIMVQLGSPRQTLMFSATWPQEVRKIAKDYQNKPVKVTVGSDDLEASKNVTQLVDVVEPKTKNGRLLDLLRKYHKSRKNKVLIFALYKKEAARLESFLQYKGYNTRAIHGDLSQGERSRVLQEFKSGRVPLMIATDVAARGLDVPDVEYVINYTFPLTIEEYVHRIGRTGRAGAKGTAHTFFTQHDKHHAGALGNVLRQAGVEVPQALMKFGQHTKRKVHPVYGAHYRQTDDLADAEPTRITFDSDSDEE